MVDPIRHNKECGKLSLVRSQPYTHSASEELAKDYSNAEADWVPEQDLEPAIQCIVSNTDWWGIARKELMSNLKEQRTVEELAELGSDDAEVYLNVVAKARKALEEAQRCRSLGAAKCSTEECDSYVKLAQALGITDYNTLAAALTPLRHISTGGVLRSNNMSGAAWVQIDHGKLWDLQKEPSLAKGDTEAIMAVMAHPVDSSLFAVDHDWEESTDLEHQRHFSVFNVQITVGKTPISLLTGIESELCKCWGSIQEDEKESILVTTLVTEPTEADSDKPGCNKWMDSCRFHRQLVKGWNSTPRRGTDRGSNANINCVETHVNELVEKDTPHASVFTTVLNTFA
jgi:hypothetical protein